MSGLGVVKKDENIMSNGSSSNSAKRVEKNLKKNNTGGPTSGSGWVTVQKKEKTEKQRFARKGRHGLAWRVPHDSTNEKKKMIKKQSSKKKYLL